MIPIRRVLTAVSVLALVGVAVTATSASGGRSHVAFKPVIGKAVTVPAQAVAGKPLAVSFKVTRSDTGTRLLKGRMICDPSVAGKVIRHAESFRAGTARLAFVVPATAQGKLLKVKVTIKATGGTSATKVTTFRVQGGAKPVLAIADASVAEGNTGATTLTFSVTLSSPSAQTVSVNYATSDGTAAAPGDYAAGNGTLTFKPGETSKLIAVSVVADTSIEQNETFTVTLSNPVNAGIVKGTATGTITNDDTAVPVTAGSYKGLLDGNFIFFDVLSDRTITGMRFNYFREDCNGGAYIYGTLNLGSTRYPIASDASFRFTTTDQGTVAGSPATFFFDVGGRFAGTNATGTVLGTSEFDYQGTHYKCSSGTKSWSAALQ